MRFSLFTLLLCPLLALGPRVANGQGADPAGAVAGSSSDATPIHIWRIVGAFALGAVVVAPFDGRLAREFEHPAAHRRAAVARTADVFRTLGDPGALVLTASTYVVGRISHQPSVADAGLHATEAVLVSGAMTAVVKALAGRARPYTVGNADAWVFHPLRFEAGYSAFPSGHTTVAFAAASSVSAEVARSEFAQRHSVLARTVSPVLYGAAALVGVSRMYHDAHWASDVVVGAGIGTLTGQLLVRRQHTGSHRRLDRWLMPSGVVPTIGGAAVTWTATFH
mgnify:CR=1 FL=1